MFHVDYVVAASQIAEAVIKVSAVNSCFKYKRATRRNFKNVKRLCPSGLDVALFPADVAELPPALQLGHDLSREGISVDLVEAPEKSPGWGQRTWEEDKLMRSVNIVVFPE